MTRSVVVLVACLAAAAGVAEGHHSFTAYALDETVTMEGEVVEFQFRNPHVWIFISVAREGAEPQRFGLEWINPGGLNQHGVTKNTFTRGDRVIVTGSPARDPLDRAVLLHTIERRADGWKWIGAAPGRPAASPPGRGRTTTPPAVR
jgi:hypothetical protein